MKELTEEQAKSAAIAARELEYGEWPSVQLQPYSAFSLVGVLQLACRHPEFEGPTRVFIEQFARDLQAKVAEGRPECGKIMERGWDKFFDA